MGEEKPESPDWGQLSVDGLTTEGILAIKNYLRILEQTDFSLLTTAQLTDLQKFINGMRFFMPTLIVDRPIVDIVRVTKNPRAEEGWGIRIHQISRLKYPPKDKVKIEMGRANFPNHSVLYGSFFGLTALNEMRIKAGDLVTRTEWRMITYLDSIKATCVFNDPKILGRLPHFGDFHAAYKSELAKRPALEIDVVEAFTGFIARQFTKEVPANKKVNYLITAFMTDLWLNQNNIEALIYPSVQTDLRDACIAMRPDVFDNMFYPVRSTEMLVHAPDYATKTAVATIFDEKNNAIHWDVERSLGEEQLIAFQEQEAKKRAAPT